MKAPRLTCDAAARDTTHTLYLLPAAKALPAALPERALWQAVLKRRDLKAAELAKSPQALDLADGRRAACVMVDAAAPRFERLTALRKAVMLLLDENPRELAIVPLDVPEDAVRDAAYVALLNAVPLPAQKKKPAQPLQELRIADRRVASAVPVDTAAHNFSAVSSLAAANTLARELTALPPNALPPAAYRKRVRALARAQGWKIEEYDFKRLKKMGAGAFCAVAQGSGHEDAAIVHLSHRPKGAKRHIALVGKGICFDTGGHNLKPAKYMAGMHEDMNGSAVALALTQALADLKLPVAVDCWLAIAENHLSPEAYIQGDIVTALDGSTIEIVHTDAEGRLVLADTLALAAKPAEAPTSSSISPRSPAACTTRWAAAIRESSPAAMSLAHWRSRPAVPAASASAPSRSTPTTSRRSTPRSPTSSNARSTARPTTSSRRASSSVSPTICPGCTWTCRPRAAAAG